MAEVRTKRRLKKTNVKRSERDERTLNLNITRYEANTCNLRNKFGLKIIKPCLKVQFELE